MITLHGVSNADTILPSRLSILHQRTSSSIDEVSGSQFFYRMKVNRSLSFLLRFCKRIEPVLISRSTYKSGRK